MANIYQYEPLPIADSVEIGSQPFSVNTLPKGIKVLENAGISGVQALEGAVIYRAADWLYEVRATITPGGDYLVMFPSGGHYNCTDIKTNTMIALRSSDKGRTWSNPYAPFNIDYNQHGFIPLIPKGSKRIYSFGTQPVFGTFRRDSGLFENAPIGYLWSDDDGYTWTGPTLISPANDPGFTGMSVMRMCETDKGTWLIGSHAGYHEPPPMITDQYILRSENQGESWELLPGRRKNGWHVAPYRRMDEGRVIQACGRLLLITRSPSGYLWALWSDDDGKTWTEPRPTPLAHPDAPPMITLLPDEKTLVCFHHNRFHDLNYTGLQTHKPEIMKDRSEIWASMSTDCGETWSEPGFLYCTAALPDFNTPFRNFACSYNDLVPDGDILNIFVPHRWQQVLHLRIPVADLYKLPTKADLKL